MSDVTIYHNPDCGTSRNTLALIRSSGVEPTVIEYLKTPPSREMLMSLVERVGMPVRAVLRVKGTPYKELGLDGAQWSDEQLIDQVLAHPILMNRPIVVSPLGVRLCRPSDMAAELLPQRPANEIRKEDGAPFLADEPVAGSDPAFAAALREAGLPPTTWPSRDAASSPMPHAPRFLMLYGSLRERSYSRLLTLEAARLLRAMGGEVRIYDPAGLPLPDAEPDSHPKVRELREAAAWAEGMVWTSPERHGAMTGIMKAQIDWIPLELGAVRPTQGKTLAVMQVCGGSQSFNAVNQLRVLGRWMRLLTIPNQSSVAKAFLEFDDAGRMKPSAFYDRVVDVMEELMKFTLLTRDLAPYLVDRYSERKESAEALSRRVSQGAI
jgi:arsenic resistance protein ArsH